ncbi:MAG: hypothetical protein HZB92_02240 [Euryarchaeota archaeon]|nr:hypothetical protein [Euryarchaeota archaeon]
MPLKKNEIDLSKISDVPSIISKITKKAIHEGGSKLLDELKHDAPRILKEHQLIRRNFEKRLYDIWKKPLDLLGMFIVMSHETGETFNKKFRPVAVKENDFIFEVLIRLHGRACLTAYEIHTLLRSGYASGAHARWRTLHEIAVTSHLIKMHDKELAERYLLHEIIESYKALNELKTHERKLDTEPITQDELDKLNKMRDELCRKYGKPFSGNYGWASRVVNTNRKDGHGPSFVDIEKAVGLNHLRPYYRMASHPTHANPKGIRFNLGIISSKDLILSGPSNAGLADPGQNAAISLYHVNVALLTSKPSIENLIILNSMERLLEEIKLAFIEVHTNCFKTKD